MKRKKHKSEPIANTEPIKLVMPNTTEKKMEAIVHLSMAIRELAKALGSAHIDAFISGCVVSNSKGAGISIGPE